MGFLSSLAAGISSSIADAISGVLIFIGTILLLFDVIYAGLFIFVSGCILLAASEMIRLLDFISQKPIFPFKRAAVDFILFTGASYFFPILGMLAFLFLFREKWLLVISITSAIAATIKATFAGARLISLYFKEN